MGWTTIASDVAISVVYLALPVALVVAARQRQRDAVRKILWMFALFIATCGLIHVCDVIIFWMPIYPAQTVVKVVTAVLSLGTLGIVLKLLPRLVGVHTESQAKELVERQTRILVEEAEVRKLAEKTVQLEVERIMRELAHDLKEPARASASFSEILLDRGEELPEEMRQDFLQRINSSSHRIMDMIKEMRGYALATAGNGNGAIKMVPFKKVVETAFGRLDRLIEGSDAEIERAIGVADDTAVGESLIRVIQNLVENSIKYTKPGLHPRIWVSATEEGDEIFVEVRDAGMGFNPDQASYIFEPFHRLEPHANRPGTGMGLAISRDIITKLGGRIWAESEGEGTGAAFFFRVPSERESSNEQEVDRSSR